MNNFAKIMSLLAFNKLGDFYFIQIFKRRKDNPDLNKSEKLIKSYTVFSIEEYKVLEPKIIEVCKANNARAYIRLNRRNTSDLALKMASACIDMVSSKQTDHLPKLFDSVCGKYNSEPNKTWVVDIDKRDKVFMYEVSNFIHEICEQPYHHVINTMNGYHLITAPFNRKLFSEKYPDIDVHLDNPTLLYFSPSPFNEPQGTKEA